MGNSRPKPLSHLIDKSDSVCDWVELGELSYKICNRNFECENCPLEKALRGFFTDASVITRNSFRYFSSLDHLVKIKQSENYFVSSRHVWIEIVGPHEVKLGIDNVAAVVLGSVDEITLPRVDEKITKGGCCGHVKRGKYNFSIPTPVAGRIKVVNPELQLAPNQLTLDPVNRGWMLIVEPKNLSQDLSYCRNGETLFSWYLDEMKWLEYKLSETCQAGSLTSDILLDDMGVFSRDLINSLPPEHYLNLVTSVLGDITC
ncbi:MAG: glycine cleavage system protein H [Candidatus Zhuqueibacterota bacterium]